VRASVLSLTKQLEKYELANGVDTSSQCWLRIDSYTTLRVATATAILAVQSDRRILIFAFPIYSASYNACASAWWLVKHWQLRIRQMY
jgi:hypothetical protein